MPTTPADLSHSVLEKHGSEPEVSNPDELKAIAADFWNNYVYPSYENLCHEMFPKDTGQKQKDIQIYSNKMTIALCDWLRRNSFIRKYKARTIVITYDAYKLSWGILVEGIPITVISHEDFIRFVDALGQENETMMQPWWKRIFHTT